MIFLFLAGLFVLECDSVLHDRKSREYLTKIHHESFLILKQSIHQNAYRCEIVVRAFAYKAGCIHLKLEIFVQPRLFLSI